MTEGWFATQMYCVACGDATMQPHPNNARANDFFCLGCGASVELKSSKKSFGDIVPDGAFGAMIDRLERHGGGPSLALLRYCEDTLAVRDLSVVPASFLTIGMILRRPPLGANARRGGWVGCNIRVADVPAAARITVVQDGISMPREEVVGGFRRAVAIHGDLTARSWLVDTLRCVERLGAEFALAEVYAFEAELRDRHPGNRHIRPKLRQQLQRLRDAGFLTFLGDGRYRRAAVQIAGLPGCVAKDF